MIPTHALVPHMSSGFFSPSEFSDRCITWSQTIPAFLIAPRKQKIKLVFFHQRGPKGEERAARRRQGTQNVKTKPMVRSPFLATFPRSLPRLTGRLHPWNTTGVQESAEFRIYQLKNPNAPKNTRILGTAVPLTKSRQVAACVLPWKYLRCSSAGQERL